MIKTYLIVATLIFFVEAFFLSRKLLTSLYPRRPSLVTKTEDRINLVVYLVFVMYGLIAIFTI